MHEGSCRCGRRMGDSVREEAQPDELDTLVFIPAAELHLVGRDWHHLACLLTAAKEYARGHHCEATH